MPKCLMLAIFNLAGGEVLLILALLLILVGAKRLPELWKGLGNGFARFRDESDGLAREAGESLGGIYGKPAGEALTPNNETAELYDPAVFHTGNASARGIKRNWIRRLGRFSLSVWRFILARFN